MEKSTKKALILISFAALLFAVVTHFTGIWGYVTKTLAVMKPLVIGAVLAFIITVPMTGMEKVLKKSFSKLHIKVKDSLVSVMSLVFVCICIVALLLLILNIALPQLINSISGLISYVQKHLPTWKAELKKYDIDLNQTLPYIDDISKEGFAKEFLSDSASFLNMVLGTAASTFSVFTTLFWALSFMIYFALAKNDIGRWSAKLINANIKKEKADKILHVAKLTRSTYTKFFSGQCIEAVILGFLMFFAFKLFGIPYAGLSALITAVCSFVPFVGAMLSCAIAVVLSLTASPLKAVICYVVYQSVQFVENQFIYPRVVGTSVGLSPVLTFASVFLGGSLFGVMGILFFIPLMSVIYILVKEDTDLKLKGQKDPIYRKLATKETRPHKSKTYRNRQNTKGKEAMK
ncbi:MAG: AI-2E family transporter [Firmicutes bacterium]|nr:AI-2E family transporter [Bacillota bacterium]